jgi:hemoglobin-like flavoprotein
MTPRQIELVQASFRRVAPNSDRVADLFYDRLFGVTPDLRAMFPSDLSAQKEKLAQMLGTAIGNLHQLYTIMPTIRELGARHVGYGVTVPHYALVGGALLWAIEKELGSEFTPELRTAWTEVYTALAGAMNGSA